MRALTDWDEADLQALIVAEEPESTTLEYKAVGGLPDTKEKKFEASKDVSAMANAAGGRIIYGMVEKAAKPVHVEGVDPVVFTRERLDLILSQNIQPPVSGLTIKVIKLGTGLVAYVVDIPQGTTMAPHQASDGRYYRRRNTTTDVMDHWEIEDIRRRSTRPDLFFTHAFEAVSTMPNGLIGNLRLQIGNRSEEPALYATVRVTARRDLLEGVPSQTGWHYSDHHLVEPKAKGGLATFQYFLNASRDQPVFKGVMNRLNRLPLRFDDESTAQIAVGIACPGFSMIREGIVVWYNGGLNLFWDDEQDKGR